jgi:hypothetical protein
MDEEVLAREEPVALLFTMNDISRTLLRIERLLEGRRAEQADRARAIANADRLRELAEKAQAELDQRKPRET